MSGPISPEVDRFLSHLQGVRKNGANWSARCPCRYDDDNPSLSIGQGNDGRVLVTCHRGTPCSLDTICESVGLKIADLMPPKDERETAQRVEEWKRAQRNAKKREAPVSTPKKKQKLDLVDTYDYTDLDGNLLFQKLRFVDENGKKTFRQRRPVGDGWEYNLDGVDQVLYNLIEVADAVARGETIVVVEGEKDVETLRSLGKVATTMPGGAGKWRSEHTETLSGATVVVISDNDEVGKTHAITVRDALAETGASVKVLIPDGVKDVTDLIEAGGSIKELRPYDPDLDMSEPDDPFQPALNKIEKIFERDDISISSKITRANMILSELGPETQARPTGRLVKWSDFVEEDIDESYDWIIPDLLERGERVMVVAAEGVGKRANINSMIPTPSGWIKLGDIKIGDQVFDRFGNVVNVTYVSPVEPNPDAYRVMFSDGNHVDADAEHQWYTETLNEREKRQTGSVRTTAEIRDTLISNRSSKALNHAIPTTQPLQLPEALLPIAPYTLGAWLGDGATVDGSICTEDPEILEYINRDGFDTRHRPSTKNIYGILGLQAKLRNHGLLGYKHVPAVYSRASYEQRLALVQGLMDTDGTVDSRGTCEFSVTNKNLAEGFLDVLLTLGIKATMKCGDAKLYGRKTGTRYRISFRTDIPVFRLSRKKDRLPEELPTPRSRYRYITTVEKIDPVPMLCISVDGPDNTYLIGESYIPTHNTMLGRQVALLTASGIHPFTFEQMKPIRTLMVDLENPQRIIRRTSSDIQRKAHHYGFCQDPQAHLLIKPDGLDLLKSQDRTYLEEAIEEIRPDLLLLGPVYKSFVDPGGRTSEAIAIEIAKYFDSLREWFKCAMWFEHHAPLGSTMSTRDLRPFGSAVWSRWPEFGLSLTPDPTAHEGYVYDVNHFRGARDQRKFPLKMTRGRTFPFEVLEFAKVD